MDLFRFRQRMYLELLIQIIQWISVLNSKLSQIGLLNLYRVGKMLSLRYEEIMLGKENYVDKIFKTNLLKSWSCFLRKRVGNFVNNWGCFIRVVTMLPAGCCCSRSERNKKFLFSKYLERPWDPRIFLINNCQGSFHARNAVGSWSWPSRFEVMNARIYVYYSPYRSLWCG
jgi:hypothetical protein